jgi:hypothetical protein
MSFLHEHQNLIRLVLLLLFVVALAGPWFFDEDSVEPRGYCDERFVLVAEDRCATLVPGMQVIIMLPLIVLATLLPMLLAGQLSSLPGMIAVFLTLLALFVPFLNNIRLLVRGSALPKRRTWRTALALATLIGAAWPVLMSFMVVPLTFRLFWGIWLYVATALLALAFELLLARRSPSAEAPQTVLPAVE